MMVVMDRNQENDPIISIRRSEWRAVQQQLRRLENRMDNLTSSHLETKKTADAVSNRQMIDRPIGGPGNSVTDLED